jgi:hypothetical protein
MTVFGRDDFWRGQLDAIALVQEACESEKDEDSRWFKACSFSSVRGGGPDKLELGFSPKKAHLLFNLDDRLIYASVFKRLVGSTLHFSFQEVFGFNEDELFGALIGLDFVVGLSIGNAIDQEGFISRARFVDDKRGRYSIRLSRPFSFALPFAANYFFGAVGSMPGCVDSRSYQARYKMTMVMYLDWVGAGGSRSASGRGKLCV